MSVSSVAGHSLGVGRIIVHTRKPANVSQTWKHITIKMNLQQNRKSLIMDAGTIVKDVVAYAHLLVETRLEVKLRNVNYNVCDSLQRSQKLEKQSSKSRRTQRRAEADDFLDGDGLVPIEDDDRQ